MYEWARKRIRDYILQDVPEHLQQRVHETCKTMHPHLGLVAWDVQGSGDGYRQAPDKRRGPHRTFEAHVTTLMQMNLANRQRASQVLEGLSNNLAAAVELLLAYYNRR